jgi:hypothetical protein
MPASRFPGERAFPARNHQDGAHAQQDKGQVTRIHHPHRFSPISLLLLCAKRLPAHAMECGQPDSAFS